MNIEDFLKVIKIPAAVLTVTVKKEDREGIVKKIQEMAIGQIAEISREENGTKIICANKTVVFLRDKESLPIERVRQFEELRVIKEIEK